jgi:O-antigen polymerase
LSSTTRKTKIISVNIFLVLAFFAGSFLYHYKKDSADGRMFIWKNSMEMIAQKPFSGYGYGLFERNYNLWQANYFESGKGNQKERTNADHVHMAYNEYTQQMAEGGIIGLIFYAGILFYLISISIRNRDWEAIAVLSSLTIMGFFNFTLEAIPIWPIICIYGVSISNREKPIFHTAKPSVFFYLFSVFASSSYLYLQSNLLLSQLKLKQAIELSKQGNFEEARNILENYRNKAGTSELYFSNMGKILTMDKKLTEASFCLDRASLYSSSPNLYFSKAHCYIKLQRTDPPEQCLRQIKNMIPQNMESNYLLMKLYIQTNNISKAKEEAEFIVHTLPELQTAKSQKYNEETLRFLKKQAGHQDLPNRSTLQR